MKKILFLLLFIPLRMFAQDDACGKCEMLKEQYEAAVSPEKENIYAFFKQECLQTDSVYTSDEGKVVQTEVSTVLKVVTKGKCIDYQIVKEYDKKSAKETRSYNVNKKDTIYTIGTTMPLFPGGESALLKFLAKNIKYPANSKQKNIQGTVYLQFVVTRDGKVTSVKPIRGPSPELNSEAVRVVKMMPDWEPGSFKDAPISMVYKLPVRFKIQ